MHQSLNSQHAVYVGSFDPVTLGHLDIIRRGANIFTQVTVGIGINPDKRPLFTPEERLELARQVLAPLKNVRVDLFHGLAVEFVRHCGAGVMLRGVRTLSDIETEFTMTLANRALDPDIDTVFLMASEKYTHISSTLIKQVALMGRDETASLLADFAPVLGHKTYVQGKLLSRLAQLGFIERRGGLIFEGPLLDVLLDYRLLADRIIYGTLGEVLTRAGHPPPAGDAFTPPEDAAEDD